MRTFRDTDGTEWQVWKVVPVSPLVLERRRADRRRDDAEGAEGGDRRASDRRSPARGSLKDGWLCFQAGEEKRRLAPVPADWETCSEQKLTLLHRAASTVRGRSPDH